MSLPPSVLPAISRISTVTLRTADLGRLRAFYTELLGLQAISATADDVTLGARGTPLLRLRAVPELPRAPATRPGLYHTAFLLPSRADLGRWLTHASRLGLGLGGGDHLVSEAFYLSDPDGNGIEVYADRPRETWTYHGGQVQMATLAVDAGAMLAAAGITPRALERGAVPSYAGAPAGTGVGHVHLKVGDARAAARFYREALGLEVTAQLDGAAFLSWGGYHHHLGLNEWHTRGQGPGAAPATGLEAVEVLTPDLAAVRARLTRRPDVQDGGDHLTLCDPWGNAVTVRQTDAGA